MHLAAVSPFYALLAARICIGDPSQLARSEAAEILGAHGSKLDELRLVKAAGDTAWEVRSSAVIALGRFTSKRAQRVVTEHLVSDPHETVRRDAAMTLPRHGPSMLRILSEAKSKERHPIARVGNLYGIYALGERSALDGALILLRDPEMIVRDNVVNGLEPSWLEADDAAKVRRAFLAAKAEEPCAGVRDDIDAKLKEISEWVRKVGEGRVLRRHSAVPGRAES